MLQGMQRGITMLVVITLPLLIMLCPTIMFIPWFIINLIITLIISIITILITLFMQFMDQHLLKKFQLLMLQLMEELLLLQKLLCILQVQYHSLCSGLMT